MITLVVVTYRLDIALLERFITTAVQYWDKSQLQKILVIYNDTYEYFVKHQDFIKQLAPDLVDLRWCNTLWPEQDQYDWCSQQQLKLLAAEHVDTEWFIVHDSKDYYTKPTDESYFFNPTGVCLLHPVAVDFDRWAGVAGNHRYQYENAYQLFGLDLRDETYILRTYQASTFPLHTHNTKQLLTFLRQQFGFLFNWLLLLQRNQQSVFTEYGLVSAWYAHDKTMHEYYSPIRSPSKHFRECLEMSKDLRGKQIV
jgi:hypothetical protein